MTAIAPTTPTRAEFVERIQAIEQWWEQSGSVARLAIGKLLVHARATLQHGEFLGMLETLGYQPRYAQKLMEVARNPELVNTPLTAHLPESPTVLYELAKMPAEAFRQAVEAGDIHPELTQREARAVAATRPLIAVQARTDQELGKLIEGPSDFIATFKGYRAKRHMSQAEVDAQSNRDGWNYTGKQEIGIRAMVTDECWSSLASMSLGMLLLPLENFLRLDKCPCCGKGLGV